MATISSQHIETREGVCGGKPCVVGTRIRVWDIHVWHNLRGQSPEEIVALYPQLSLADVHAALAYYLDNREALEQAAEADRAEIKKFESAQAPTRFAQLRDELLKEKNGSNDALPS